MPRRQEFTPTSRRFLDRFRRAAPLPDAVYRELIEMLFSMAVPVIYLGSVFVGVTALVLWEWHDPIVAILSALGAIVTALRLLVIRGYRRHKADCDIAEIRLWERRYAIGNYAFALLLGLFNARMLMFHLPLVHMVAVSLVFGFGAGVVARISIRPVICVTSLLLAVVPTVIALALHALVDDSRALHGDFFMIEALVLGTTALLSMHSLDHLYRTMVAHLTAEHDLSLLARHDALTRLPNRLMLREAFQRDFAAMTDTNSHMAVHFLDLDGFKAVNDVHGHPAGDAVLREVASRLLGTVRAEDTVSRLGGDEFVVLQTMIAQDSEAEMLARRIIKKLSLPYLFEGTELRISVSVGIAIAPHDGADLERLITRADTALYRAKGRGKGQLSFYTRETPAAPDGENQALARS
ncbi:MAG: GGDEF domain-containing protein [Sphingomonas sp.]